MTKREKALKRIKEMISELEQIQSDIYTILDDNKSGLRGIDKSGLSSIDICELEESAFDLGNTIYKLENI